VSYRTVGEGDVVDVSLPSTQGVAEEEGIDSLRDVMAITTHQGFLAALEALKALTVDADAVDVFTTPDQLDEELITLTLLPRSRWQTLLNLEVIQVCKFLWLWLYVSLMAIPAT
jgi:U3 small nucleolar RNA-associated protein 21